MGCGAVGFGATGCEAAGLGAAGFGVPGRGLARCAEVARLALLRSIAGPDTGPAGRPGSVVADDFGEPAFFASTKYNSWHLGQRTCLPLSL